MPGATQAVTHDQLPLFDRGPDTRQLRDRALVLAMSSKAENTRRAYASDWRLFEQWCRAAGRSSLPATTDTVRLFLTAELERRACSTVNRRMAAIAHKHRDAGAADPVDSQVRKLMAGARREKGTAPKQKAAITPEQLRAMCRRMWLDPSEQGARDRAILTLGFAAGTRRSELVALDVRDLRFAPQGVAITLRRGKTDQDGRGREIGVFYGRRAHTCPVRALRDWLTVRGKHAGPLFTAMRTGTRLSCRSIGELVKRQVAGIGLDPRDYGAHSLRAGCVTAAILGGAQAPLVMQRTGHRSMATLEKYVRTATLFSVDVLRRAM